jgi:DNA-binding protein HU-beta
MNQKDLLRLISAETKVTQKDVKKVLDSFMSNVVRAIAEKDEVVLVGFGRFFARDSKPRNARNPATGEPLHIPAKTRPYFSAGKNFKEALKP